MADLNAIHRQVRERMSELDTLLRLLRFEQARLEQLVEPDTAPGPEPAHRPRSAPRAQAAGMSARAGASVPTQPNGTANRTQQMLEQIRLKPGISASELAATIGTESSYVHRVLATLQNDGTITKQGKGYHPSPD
jgi:predicted HTH transcriptional regulator